MHPRHTLALAMFASQISGSPMESLSITHMLGHSHTESFPCLAPVARQLKAQHFRPAMELGRFPVQGDIGGKGDRRVLREGKWKLGDGLE